MIHIIFLATLWTVCVESYSLVPAILARVQVRPMTRRSTELRDISDISANIVPALAFAIPSLICYSKVKELESKLDLLKDVKLNVVKEEGPTELEILQRKYDKLENAFNKSLEVINSFGDDMKGSLVAYKNLYDSANVRMEHLMETEKKREIFEDNVASSVKGLYQMVEIMDGEVDALKKNAQRIADASTYEVFKVEDQLDLVGVQKKLGNLKETEKIEKMSEVEKRLEEEGWGKDYLRELSSKTVKDLRTMCKERDLAVKGTKAELIAKLDSWKRSLDREIDDWIDRDTGIR
jgi:hypothetical protein